VEGIVEEAIRKHVLVMLTKTGERLYGISVSKVGTKAAGIAKAMSKPLKVQMKLQKLAIRSIGKTHGPVL